MQHVLEMDASWGNSAREYEKMYEDAIADEQASHRQTA